MQVQPLTWDQNDEKYREVLGGIVGGPQYQGPALFVETLEAVYEIKYNFSQNAKDIIKEAYSIDLSLELTSDTIKSISDNLLFQKDKNDIDTTHDYWYFNGDFTSNPQFDRLELMEKVQEAVYTLKNDDTVFSANANSILKEAYGIDVKGTITPTIIETLSNDILFQKDTKGTSGRTYWYFNGEFDTAPPFDRLKMLGVTYEAVYTLKNDDTVFSANANSISRKPTAWTSKAPSPQPSLKPLCNDILFQKDTKVHLRKDLLVF